MTEPPSDRVRVRRLPERGAYDRRIVREILDAAAIAHVGVSAPSGPVVLPMAFGRTEDTLYLHGSVANGLLRSGAGAEVCVTVTHVDGLVLARSVFHHSMNYRSVVVRGAARRVDDDAERDLALRCITDHVLPRWDDSREPNRIELRQTLVLAVPLTEASAKVRTGDPRDDAEDLSGPWWAGVVPVEVRFGQPVDAGDLRAGVAVPRAVRDLAGPRP
jgi:nitroimidazol reductase NimA-like FMN-containing flavoprotein (pyridoxamine 5'-phosphate oxidase superfamily)